MRRKSLVFFVLFFLTSTSLLLVACSKSESANSATQKKIGYISNGIASFWVIAGKGAKAAAREFGVQVSVLMPENITAQKRMVEDLLIRGVDGIAISPIDPANQKELIDIAASKTLLITHDSDAPGTKRLAYIGMDNYIAGRMTGELVKEALPDGGTVMILIGRVEQDNAKRRRQGVIDELLDRPSDSTRYDPPGTELKGEHYTILGTLTDQFDRAKAKANCEDSLSRHPDLGALVGLFVYNPPVCLEALTQMGRLGQVQLIGFDEADETLQAIKDGYCYGTVVQNPYRYGYESVRVLTALANGEDPLLPANGFLDIPARKITRANVEQFWAELKEKIETQ